MPMPWVARLQLVCVCVSVCVCLCELLDHDEGGCSYTEILEHKIIGGQCACLFCFSPNKQTKETWATMKYLTFHDNRPHVIWSLKKNNRFKINFSPYPCRRQHFIPSASQKAVERDQIGKHFCINCIVWQSCLPASVICLLATALAIRKGRCVPLVLPLLKVSSCLLVITRLVEQEGYVLKYPGSVSSIWWLWLRAWAGGLRFSCPWMFKESRWCAGSHSTL